MTPGAEPIPWPIWRTAAVIAFGAFMSGLDASVVNVGLDTIARDVHAPIAEAQWVANGYLVALAVSLPACAWLARRAGPGRVWLGALAGFTIASGLCAAAGDVRSLIALRVVQGLSGGLLIPAGQTVIGQAVGPHRLGRVMATLGVAVSLAPALGPTAGGLVLHVASWPWLFLVNVPVGALALAAGVRWVPRGTGTRTAPLDGRGLVLLSAGIPLLVYGLTEWGARATPATPSVLAPLVPGALALAAFAVHARRTPHPIVDLAPFATRAFRAASVAVAFSGASMFGAGLLFPLYFQLGRGRDPFTTGLLVISMSIGTAAALPWTGRLVDRFGGGPISAWGGLAAVATTLPFALLDLDANALAVQLLLLVRGMAIAMATMPATTAAYKAVDAERLPDAATHVTVLQRVGGALGGALFAVVLGSRLAGGAGPAFHTAFWWLTAASVLGLVAALWLTLAERAYSS